MFKPTDQELKDALEEAERIREQGDELHLAKTMQYLQHRNSHLEKVFQAAMQYMQFGQEEHEHTVLLLAIKAARDQESKDTDEELNDTGL